MPAMAEPFPKLIIKSFVEGCSEDDQKMLPYCECTINELQKRMTTNEFTDLIELPEDEMMDNEGFNDSIMACVDEIPQ